MNGSRVTKKRDSTKLECPWADLSECTGKRARKLGPVLDEMRTAHKERVYAEDWQLDAVTLWNIHTWFYRLFVFTPRLFVFSALPGSGKSTLLDSIRRLCPLSAKGASPLAAAQQTASTLYRLIDKDPWIVQTIEEIDQAKKDGKTAMINAGSSRNGVAVVNEDRGRAAGGWQPTPYSCFSALMMAGIGIDSLENSTLSRSILIRLHPAPDDVELKAAEDETEEDEDEADELRRDIASAIDKVWDRLPKVEVPKVQGLGKRLTGAWKPLFAIAELAGEDWPERARKAALESQRALDREQGTDPGVTLLGYCQDAFDVIGEGATEKPQKLRSTDLLFRVMTYAGKDELDLGFFGEPGYHEQRNAQVLSKLLKPHGIKPDKMRIPGYKTPLQGYRASDFEPYWE
jgi:Protein of unknown function (DUF3631)